MVKIFTALFVGLLLFAGCEKNEIPIVGLPPSSELSLEIDAPGMLSQRPVEDCLQDGGWYLISRIEELPAAEKGCRRFLIQVAKDKDIYEPVEVVWKEGMVSQNVMAGHRWLIRLVQNVNPVEPLER